MIYEKDMCLLKWMEEQSDKCGIIQQLNCFWTQGGGIALRIRKKYPSMYDADVKFGERGDKSKLGTFCYTELLPDKIGYGLYGQFAIGMGRNTNYEAVHDGLKHIEIHARENGLKTLGLPCRMGSVLGGGDWRVIRAIVQVIFEDSPLDLYICNYEG